MVDDDGFLNPNLGVVKLKKYVCMYVLLVLVVLKCSYGLELKAGKESRERREQGEHAKHAEQQKRRRLLSAIAAGFTQHNQSS